MTETSSAPMSIPSSSALVDTTRAHLTVPEAALDLAPAIRQIAAAIAADDVGRTWRAVKGVLQIRREDFHREAALREEDQLEVLPQELQRDATGLGQIQRLMPSCALTTGGLTNRKNFSPRGAPFFSTSSNERPVSPSASSRGFAIVADEQMKMGSEP